MVRQVSGTVGQSAKQTLKIDIYSMCWNEADMLGFFFRHYDPVATCYVIFDDGSTDGSLEILENHPKVEVRRFQRVVEDSFVLSAQALHNSVWKESRERADWVIITAIDEHLCHPNLSPYLESCKSHGITMIPALGFQMISTQFPAPDETLARSRTTGAPFDRMNKLCLFDPSALQETNFTPGRHNAEPEGNIVIPSRDELLNLHYKYLDLDRLMARHKLLASGLGEGDRRRKFGHRYGFDIRQLKKDWANFESQAIDIRTLPPDPGSAYPQPRWWRDPERGYRTRSDSWWMALNRLWKKI